MNQAWDLHPDQIQYITFTWRSDSSAECVSTLQQLYGIRDAKFASCLDSLGLRTGTGFDRDRMAFLSLVKQVNLWGGKLCVNLR